VNLALEVMDLAPDGFELSMVVSRQGGVTLLLQVIDLGLEFRLVDADHMMLPVRLNVESLAERRQEVLFVQLSVALQRLVFDARRDLTKLGHSFMPEFFKRVSHGFDSFLENFRAALLPQAVSCIITATSGGR